MRLTLDGADALPLAAHPCRQMNWPKAIDRAIEAIQTADFLTEDQKRDIFYNNAARFLRLSKEAIAKHHGK